MSVTGLCQICGTQPAEHRCPICGSVVCAEHYEREADRCVQCAGPGGGRQL